MSRAVSREDLNDEVLNPRLQREKAKTGAITASLVWNGPTDLDLHAKVTVADGKTEHIFFRNKKAAGGVLDVDANARDITEEPVENIYWNKPPEGTYTISVQNFAPRGVVDAVPFRVLLKLPEETLDYEGKLKKKEIANCFHFSVDAEGGITLGKLPLARIMKRPSGLPPPMRAAPKVRAMKVMKKAKAKAMKAPKAMKAMKAMKKIASGKLRKSLVFRGKFEKTSGGLKKDDLMPNRRGKIVTKKLNSAGKKVFANNIKPWLEACKKARTELGLTGFVKFSKGSAPYNKVKEILAASAPPAE